MPIRSDPLDELAIPDDTTVEEHDLVTDGDVLIGGQSTIEFGVRGGSVIAGERVTFGGHIEAEGDCRLDMWSEVDADVLVAEDAYLGERVEIGGELKVAGNLDVGDDVDIEDGFEANGWINVRNPMPTIVFLMVYLSQLLRIGEEEAAEALASQFLTADDRDEQPVVIPRGAQVSDETWRVSTPATIGEDCRLHGNVRAESLTVGDGTTIFGSLRAKGDVDVGPGTEIKGDVTTRNGDVRVDRDAHVWGDISAEDVQLHEHAVVDGRIRVSGELTQLRDPLGPELDSDGEVEADDNVESDEVEADDEFESENSREDNMKEGQEEVREGSEEEVREGSEEEGQEGSEEEGREDGADTPEQIEDVIPIKMAENPSGDTRANGHDSEPEATPDAN